jgi:hypothetical protein
LPDDAFCRQGDDKKACAVLKRKGRTQGPSRTPSPDALAASCCIEALPTTGRTFAPRSWLSAAKQTEDYRHKQLADAVARCHPQALHEPGVSASGITQSHLHLAEVGRSPNSLLKPSTWHANTGSFTGIGVPEVSRRAA